MPRWCSAPPGLAFGCGGAVSPPRPDTGWYERMLGGPANIALVIHVAELLRDPYYGPMARAGFERRAQGVDSLEHLLGGADQVDIVGSIGPDPSERSASFVIVIHGPPNDADPERLADDEGRRYFGPAHKLASGAVELEQARNRDVGLYVLPDAWVVVHGAALARARSALAASSADPPRFELAAGTLVSAWAQRAALNALRLHRLRQSTHGLLDSLSMKPPSPSDLARVESSSPECGSIPTARRVSWRARCARP